MGYVYLIKDVDNGVYKIGVTRKDNMKRIKQLQTGNYSVLEEVYSFKTDYPFRLESMLHNYFKDSHVRGEWFNLENPETFINICERLQHNINILMDNPYFSKHIK